MANVQPSSLGKFGRTRINRGSLAPAVIPTDGVFNTGVWLTANTWQFTHIWSASA